MKKILLLLFLLFSLKSHSQSIWEIYQDKVFSKPSVGISWSLNTLNPYGLALTYSGGRNNLFAMINYNNGIYRENPPYTIYDGTGIYRIGSWGNRKIGELSTIDYDRNIYSASIGKVVKRTTKLKLSLYAGVGIYSVRTTEWVWNVVTDDWNVLDDYVTLKEGWYSVERPFIFTGGFFIDTRHLCYGAGFNTPPRGSGAPPRFNFMLGFPLNR
jgi:hypothetical protein